MATAAFNLMKCTGTDAGDQTNSVRNPCFINTDEHSTGTGTRQVAVPATGASANYSYENWLLLECTAAPNNQVVNVKFWGPSQQPDYADTPGNKITVLAGTTGTGVTPKDTVSTVATTTQHDNYNGPGVGEYLAIDVVPGDAKIDAVGEETEFIVLQLKVEAGAQRGDGATVPFMIGYDES